MATRGTQWLWSHHHVHSKFQELAEPEPLETDVALDSIMLTRAAKLLTICSLFVIFASCEATVWENVWTQFSNLDILCMSRGNFAICMNNSFSFTSIVLVRYPVATRSGRGIIRRTQIRKGSWQRRYRHICSVGHTFHEKSWETKLGCRHLKTKKKKALTQENTAHVRTRNGLSQNSYGQSKGVTSVIFRCSMRR